MTPLFGLLKPREIYGAISESKKAAAKLSIQTYFSTVTTSKDNPEIDRFNETLEYEWLYSFNLSLDSEKLNPGLTERFIEYNHPPFVPICRLSCPCRAC